MQPEIYPTEAALQPPPSDLLPAQRRKGVPRATSILAVGLLAAATFLAGIEAQKQWGGSSSSGGLGARGAAFGAGAGAGTGTTTGTGTAGANGGTQGPPGAGGGFFRRGGGGVTTGTVKLVQGSTIYVTTTDGNTVKVSVLSSAAITKSVTTKLSGIHPGDAVTAIGTSASGGVIKATSLRLGDTGFPGGFGQRPAGQSGNGNTAPPSTTGG